MGRPEDPAILELIAGADLVVESFAPGEIDRLALPERFPGLVLLSISGFGRGGPCSARPWSEFTIQAECGSIGTRGRRDQPPVMAGGRTTEWLGGTYAAVAALAAVQRARRTGQGEHIDFSLLEVMNIAATTYIDLMYALAGEPAPHRAGAHRRDPLDRAHPRRLGRLQHQLAPAVRRLPGADRAQRPAG